MTELEMLKFAYEQLEVFGENSKMAEFLTSVIDMIENDAPNVTMNFSGNAPTTYIENVGELNINL